MTWQNVAVLIESGCVIGVAFLNFLAVRIIRRQSDMLDTAAKALRLYQQRDKADDS